MKNVTHKNQFYDTIIENLRKEWRLSMKNKIPHTEWVRPLYSKNQINKAGQVIANPDSSQEECNVALEILNNWRAAHAYPLHVINSGLRRGNPNAIVVQRLKRLESITGKIERFPQMQLYKMQDLGGCRVILDSIEQVYDAVTRYKNSRIRHILKREYDYIKYPKESGYRCYHSEIMELDKNNKIVMKLRAINQAVQTTEYNENFSYKNGYYLLILNYEEPSLNIETFKPSEFELAVNIYNKMEANLQNKIDMVLVSAKTFDSLKAAYPNYFVDISDFLNILTNVMLNYSRYNENARLLLESNHYILKNYIPMG